MGACKPHHTCGMTLPMCPVRPGREEAPLVSITREIPSHALNAVLVNILSTGHVDGTVNDLTNDG